MDQASNVFVDPGCRKPITIRVVLSLAGSPCKRRQLSHCGKVIEAEGTPERAIVKLKLDQEMMRYFPERSREAQSSFRRFFRDIEHEDFRDGPADAPAVRLQEAVRPAALQSLDRKIYKRLYRPLSSREAAGFLGLDGKVFRRLRQELGIEPCERILANRHGRSYSYAVFAVSDVIKVQLRIASPGGSGSGVTVQ